MARVSKFVELSVVLNSTLNSTINDTEFFLKYCFTDVKEILKENKKN